MIVEALRAPVRRKCQTKRNPEAFLFLTFSLWRKEGRSSFRALDQIPNVIHVPELEFLPSAGPLKDPNYSHYHKRKDIHWNIVSPLERFLMRNIKHKKFSSKKEPSILTTFHFYSIIIGERHKR